MKFIFGLISTCLFSLFLMSCSTFSSTQTERSFRLTTTTNWVRETTADNYIGPKILHNMPPLIIDQTVYQGNAIDAFTALDRKSGHTLWRNKIKNGVSAGAAFAKDMLYYAGNDGQFYAVRARTGQIVWTFPTQTESLSAPTVDDSSVYFLTANGTLFSLNLETGKQNWSYIQKDSALINIRGSSSPVIDGNLLYIGFSDGTLSAFDKTRGALKWERNLAAPQDRFRDIDASPVVSGDFLFVTNYSGGLFCLKKINGDIVWKTEEGGVSGLTAQDSKVFYSTSDGKVLSLDRVTGKVIWSHKITTGVGTKPTYFKEMILVGTSDGPLEVLSASTGETLKIFTTGWGISASVSTNPDTNDIYMVSNYGTLYSLKLNWVRPQSQWPWETL